ncbi:ABC transporter permease [Dyella mobilis]|uniref:ABC transporter permease n=1 Tax=Dyella mobilis TaxID=1849582 RepID=A0ABS2KN73_9GAMM|nr:FtsX-like permease family protein [Dyella mobilis]MBM7132252.1 ABC transporter permease [Dyella mobilis]GLQ95762.1 ABC transporter permease [Dyella mobilis]
MTMRVHPILAALRQHKAGTALIVLQIALTLAITCNALFVIHQRVARLSRPSGVDEDNVMVIQNQWVGDADAKQRSAMIAADLETLRRVAGVVDAFSTNALPLSSGGWSKGVRYTMDQVTATSPTAIYFADDHALSTLGLHLVAGRNFTAEEIGQVGARDSLLAREVIITQALADKLFPNGAAVGKTICLGSAPPSVIIGVVDRLQTWIDSYTETWVERSTLVPFRLLASNSIYVVRVQPGRMAGVLRDAPKALVAANPLRAIGAKDVETFAQLRADVYRSDHGMAVMMGVICLVLLATTAAGIVGLTSFWVGQRRRHIGVRRALGATRRDIFNYFCTENLFISVAGAAIGTCLAVGLNLLLVDRFETGRLSLGYVLVGVAVLLVLGQLAVLVPALRASRLSPVEATRLR